MKKKKDNNNDIEICHVCNKIKKPYTVILDNNVLSYAIHESAREPGPICERCNNYYAMTGKFKDATDDEYEIAIQSVIFSNVMIQWWEKDVKLINENNNNSRNWEGIEFIKQWYIDNIKINNNKKVIK